MTTHWALCDELAAQCPEVTVDRSVLCAGTDRIITSGGVTAGVDLCLYVLRDDLGPAMADHVSARIVMAPRDLGDQEKFVQIKPVPPGDDTIAAVQQWMLTSLDKGLTIRDMAMRASMSERTFHRRFRERTSLPPLAWLRDQRIEGAKELLETSDLPIEEIAGRVGLGTPANLRSQFRRLTNLSPREHRRLFEFGSGAVLSRRFDG